MTQPTAFYELFLDAELNHSAGYFDTPDMSLELAQRAKNLAILSRCGLAPSMRLLDVGCGWGAAVRIAAGEQRIPAVGITIEAKQYEYATARQARESPDAPMEFRLQSWADFREPVDGIICINAFENFDDKLGFLAHCRELLPPGGRLVMLTVTGNAAIYRVLSVEEITRGARSAGFDVTVSPSLASHYVHTLDRFVAALRRRRTEALGFVTEEQFARAVEFYTTSASLLRRGRNDMFEFGLTAR